MKCIHLETFKHVWGLLESKSTAWVMPGISSTRQSSWHGVRCPNCKSSFNHCREHLRGVPSFLRGAFSFLSLFTCTGWDSTYVSKYGACDLHLRQPAYLISSAIVVDSGILVMTEFWSLVATPAGKEISDELEAGTMLIWRYSSHFTPCGDKEWS